MHPPTQLVSLGVKPVYRFVTFLTNKGGNVKQRWGRSQLAAWERLIRSFSFSENCEPAGLCCRTCAVGARAAPAFSHICQNWKGAGCANTHRLIMQLSVCVKAWINDLTEVCVCICVGCVSVFVCTFMNYAFHIMTVVITSSSQFIDLYISSGRNRLCDNRELH